MYLLGLGLLVLSTWYLLKLFNNFNQDTVAKNEIRQAWEGLRNEAKGKNPFTPGRIKDAINSYKADMVKDISDKDKLKEKIDK